MKETKTVENYEKIRNAIFDFVYHEALNDATLQKAYNNSKDDIEKIPNAKIAIRDYIDGILFDDKKQYSFEDTVKKVRKAIADKEFTFGNIQKLINMTVKYFYISCYTNKNLRERFENCHCPMDSIMIKKARGLLSVEKRRKDLKSTTSWSKIVCKENDQECPKEYEVFREAISKGCEEKNIFPIEFDYLEWQESNNKKRTND